VFNLIRFYPRALIIFAVALLASSLYALSVPALGWFLTNTLVVRPLLIGSFFVSLSLTAVFYNQMLTFWADWVSSDRKLVASSMICGAIACWGFTSIHSYSGLLLVATVFFGLSLAAFGYSLSLIHQDLQQAADSQRNKLEPLIQACLAIAWTLGPAVGALILVYAEFVTVFWGMGVVFCFVALCALFLLPATNTAPVLIFEDVSASERMPATLYTIFFILLYAVNHAYLVSFPLYLQDAFHADMLTIASMYGLTAAIQVPVFLLIKRVMRYLSLTWLALIAVIMATVLNLGVWLSTGLWQLYLLQILVALFIGFVSCAGLKWFHARLINSGMTPLLHTNAILVGSVIGGICMAVGAESQSYQFVFAINLIVCIVAFVFLLFITRFTRCGHIDD